MGRPASNLEAQPPKLGAQPSNRGAQPSNAQNEPSGAFLHPFSGQGTNMFKIRRPLVGVLKMSLLELPGTIWGARREFLKLAFWEVSVRVQPANQGSAFWEFTA